MRNLLSLLHYNFFLPIKVKKKTQQVFYIRFTSALAHYSLRITMIMKKRRLRKKKKRKPKFHVRKKKGLSLLSAVVLVPDILAYCYCAGPFILALLCQPYCAGSCCSAYIYRRGNKLIVLIFCCNTFPLNKADMVDCISRRSQQNASVFLRKVK